MMLLYTTVYKIIQGMYYRGPGKSMQMLLSNSQAGPGKTVMQEQEEISRNHIQAFLPGSVEEGNKGRMESSVGLH